MKVLRSLKEALKVRKQGHVVTLAMMITGPAEPGCHIHESFHFAPPMTFFSDETGLSRGGLTAKLTRRAALARQASVTESVAIPTAGLLAPS